jgi:hypothetical protein
MTHQHVGTQSPIELIDKRYQIDHISQFKRQL